MTLLRILGMAGIVLGFAGMFLSLGIPWMSSGNAAGLYASLAVFVLGWMLLLIYGVWYAVTFGWAAAGVTVPSLIALGVGGLVTWWLLWGPKANGYPRMYGMGALLITITITTQVLPRFQRLK